MNPTPSAITKSLKTSAAALLSKYTNNLLKEQCEEALSARVRGDNNKLAELVKIAITLIDSFQEKDFLVCGLHRINGSIAAQQKAICILEQTMGNELKDMAIKNLSAEDKAGCLRMALRKMPDSLFPRCQRAALLDLAESSTAHESNPRVFKALHILVHFIPQASNLCLKKVLSHLRQVVSNSGVNRMGVHNIALIFVSSVFPIMENGNNMEAVKNDIEKLCRLFPILLEHANELSTIPKDLTTIHQDSALNYLHNGCYAEFEKSSDEPEIVLHESYVSTNVSTPPRATTEMEMAKLMAEIQNMPEGPNKARLMKRMQKSQRQQMGLPKKPSLLKKLFTGSSTSSSKHSFNTTSSTNHTFSSSTKSFVSRK